MADIHVEEFFKDTAIILVQLYNAFPCKATLYVEDISGSDSPDEFGLHSRRHRACFSAMLWLAEEGYLRYDDTIRQDAVDQAVLTKRAFVRLSTAARRDDLPALIRPPKPDPETPSTVQAEMDSHIHLFRAALKSGSSSRITVTLQHVLFRA